MLCRNHADYKIILHKLKITVDLMNNYTIISPDEWLIEAMMKN